MNEYDAIALCIAIVGCILLVMGLSKGAQAIQFRAGKFVIGACCLAWGMAHFADSARATNFASEAEFLAAQERAGFVKIGQFDTSWPAEYVSELIGEDEIAFARQDGTPHRYSGFAGYRLKVVRLRDAAGREPLFVLRSEFKH
jgi:hypothetical protein